MTSAACTNAGISLRTDSTLYGMVTLWLQLAKSCTTACETLGRVKVVMRLATALVSYLTNSVSKHSLNHQSMIYRLSRRHVRVHRTRNLYCDPGSYQMLSLFRRKLPSRSAHHYLSGEGRCQTRLNSADMTC